MTLSESMSSPQYMQPQVETNEKMSELIQRTAQSSMGRHFGVDTLYNLPHISYVPYNPKTQDDPPPQGQEEPLKRGVSRLRPHMMPPSKEEILEAAKSSNKEEREGLQNKMPSKPGPMLAEPPNDGPWTLCRACYEDYRMEGIKSECPFCGYAQLRSHRFWDIYIVRLAILTNSLRVFLGPRSVR